MSYISTLSSQLGECLMSLSALILSGSSCTQPPVNHMAGPLVNRRRGSGLTARCPSGPILPDCNEPCRTHHTSMAAGWLHRLDCRVWDGRCCGRTFHDGCIVIQIWDTEFATLVSRLIITRVYGGANIVTPQARCFDDLDDNPLDVGTKGSEKGRLKH